jgi:F0F1-type ATP synthase membrane subunit b/b'
MMEKEFKDLLDQAKKIVDNAGEEYDLAALKAHLAKMETEDKWEEAQKELYHLYGESKVEIEKLSKKVGEELNDIMLKLTQVV